MASSRRVSKFNQLVPTSDGIELSASVYAVVGIESCGVVIVAGGVGLLQYRYREYATYLAAKGWTVMTFDYRGVGQSVISEDLQLNSTLRDWGRLDLAACIDWAESFSEARRIIVVGHSVGGQIFAFAPNHQKVEAMIAICSQKGYWKFWDGWRRLSLLGLWHLLPVMVTLCGRLPLQHLGRGADIPKGVAQEWGRWGRYREFVDESGRSLNHVFSRVSCKILAISFSDDKFYAPPRAVEALNALYENSEHTHWHFCPEDLDCITIGHSGFFEYAECSYPLWERIDCWLNTTSKSKIK